MKIFDIVTQPGQKIFEYVDMFEHIHGTVEKMPIVIIQGQEEKPVFLLTGNIHGNEVHGLVTLQEVIKSITPENVNGTIIIIPTLNPSGLQTLTRSPFYDSADPNRLRPDPKPKKEPNLKYEDPYDKNLDPIEHPSVQEMFYTKLAEILTEVDYFIDLHCHSVRSFPFSYVDRVYYDEKKEGEKEEAQKLYDKALDMAKTFGFPIVLEDPPRHYFRQNLHRSTTGSFTNKQRKPGFTVELGASDIIITDIIKLAKKAVFNVLKWAGNLEGEPEELEIDPALIQEIWREIAVRVQKTGLYIPLVKSGEIVNINEPIAAVHDIFGEVKETILAPEYGTILAFWDDIRCYTNRSIASFLVKNTVETVLPWEYEKKEDKEE